MDCFSCPVFPLAALLPLTENEPHETANPMPLRGNEPFCREKKQDVALSNKITLFFTLR